MAKYEVKYSCGHAGTVDLVGKIAERQRKIAWLEESGLCPDCYKGQKKPLRLSVYLDASSGENPVILVFSGNTLEIKEEIKSLGYRWDDAPTGDAISDLIGMKRNMKWMKRVSMDDFKSEVDKVRKTFKGLKVKNRVTDEAISLWREFERQRKEEEEAIKAIEKPVRPSCYPSGYWNGKVYGSRKNGFSIYVDGKKMKITDEDAESLEQYEKTIAEYKQAIK